MFVSTAAAATLELVASPPATVVQQTSANPCLYGGSNCQVPAGWNLLPAVTGGGSSFNGSITYDLTLTPYSDVFGMGAFLIGVDVNDTQRAQTLNSLEVTFNTGAQYTLNPVPVSLPNSANGVGFSDFIIQLTGGGAIPVPTGATSVTFALQLSGLNDGPDRFFVIPQASEVPEPGSLLLMGTALCAAGIARWRQKKNA
jgi:hypothetical protein